MFFTHVMTFQLHRFIKDSLRLVDMLHIGRKKNKVREGRWMEEEDEKLSGGQIC